MYTRRTETNHDRDDPIDKLLSCRGLNTPWYGFPRSDPLHRGAASSPVASTRLQEREPRARSAGRRACRVTVQYPSDTGGDTSRRHPVWFFRPQFVNEG